MGLWLIPLKSLCIAALVIGLSLEGSLLACFPAKLARGTSLKSMYLSSIIHIS